MIAFLVLAVLGFVASVAVHISTFTGSHAVGMSQAWPLHVGMFVVLLPVMVGHQRDRAGSDDKGRSSNEQSSFVPRWMGAALGVCVVYAFVVFGLFIAGEVLLPRDEKIVTAHGGQVLMSHGRVFRTPGDETYRADEARRARGVSTFWMNVYAASIAGLYEGLARRRAARAALPAFPALPASIRHTNTYERAPAPRMSPWAHSTVGSILSLVAFFALPMGVAALFLSSKPSGGGWICLVAPLFFGAAIVGMRLPGALTSRWVPAACPACGGRAYADGGPLRSDGDPPARYTCQDCGRACGVDGGVVGPEGGPDVPEPRGS